MKSNRLSIYSGLLIAILMSTMVISCGGSSDDEPATPELTVNFTKLDYTKDAQTQTLAVKSNVSWSVTGTTDWCTVSAQTGTIGSINTMVVLNIACTANTTYDTRSTTLTITAGTITKTVAITQTNKEGVILTTTTMAAPALGGNIDVAFKTTGDITPTTTDSWIHYVSTRTLTDKTATFTIDANYTNAKRTGTVVFTRGEETQTLTITQDYVALSDNIPNDKTGMDSDAKTLIKKIYAGWNLGNTMEAGGETYWQNTVTSQAIIDFVKKCGFNAVRIPVSWTYGMSSDGKYTIDPTRIARVKQIVDYVINDNMYAIINIHYDQGWLESHCTTADKEAVNAQQKALWKQIAIYFRDYDEHLLFAGCNEPGEQMADAAINSETTGVILSYEQTFIDAVRATGGKNYYRNLIFQGPKTSIDLTDKYYNTMPTDLVSNRLIAEVHYYEPWQFCGLDADASWGNMFYFWGSYANQAKVDGIDRNASWGNNEAYIQAQFAKMKAKFVDKGIPMVLGEYAALHRTMSSTSLQTAHDNSVAEFLQLVTKNAKNYGIAPFVWDTNNGYLINRNKLSIDNELLLNGLMKGAEEGKYPF
jgi:endoglucanase